MSVIDTAVINRDGLGPFSGTAHDGDDPLAELTPREREVLGLIAEGLTNDGICRRLFVSPKTVETHVSAIFWKLGLHPAAGCHRRVRAVLMFLSATAPHPG